MKAKVGVCIHCGRPVSSGGDRHAKNRCPRPKGIYGEHRRRLKARREKAKRQAKLAVKRGEVVVGTGRPKGAVGGKG